MCTHPSNAVRGPFNAWFLSTLDGFINRLLAERKTRLMAGLSGSIVEIGSGVGANLSFLRPGTRLIAVEPNPHMHARLSERAMQCGIHLEIAARSAEDTQLPSDSVDAVISTLVLCTVPDPVATLAEIRRILRPGGRFVFIEHVAAPAASPRRRLQTLLRGPWAYLFEGCTLDRQTAQLIRATGFRSAEIEHYVLRSPFIPVNSQISGVCLA